jgi:hypothetical protein
MDLSWSVKITSVDLEFRGKLREERRGAQEVE